MKIKEARGSNDSWFRKLFCRRPYDLKMYAHMFVEDVYLNVLPYDDHDKPTFSITLEGANQENETELCKALERHSRATLKEGITDFIRQTAKSLVHDGRVYYRVLYKRNSKQRFEIIRFYRDDVFSVFDHHFIIGEPQNRILKEGSWGAIVCIRLPKQFWFVPQLVKDLSFINPIRLPDFALDQFDLECPPAGRIPVDINVIRESELTKLAKLTRKVGWTGRRALDDHMTEFYNLRRELDFERFVMSLRNHILTGLNQLLAQFATELEFPSTIRLVGLPTEEEIIESQNLLEKGAAPFSEVMKPFRLLPT